MKPQKFDSSTIFRLLSLVQITSQSFLCKMTSMLRSVINFQFSIVLVDQVRRWYGEGSLLFCTMDFAFELIISLFYRKKEKQKKLAAADKYAKIMILALNKKNSLRSDSFLSLTLQSHNFLTRFLQGGRD